MAVRTAAFKDELFANNSNCSSSSTFEEATKHAGMINRARSKSLTSSLDCATTYNIGSGHNGANDRSKGT